MSSSEFAIYGTPASRRVKEGVRPASANAARVRSTTPSSSSTPHAPRIRAGQRDERPWMPVPGKPADRGYMTSKNVLSQDHKENIVFIRPFRKPQHHVVPEGVPPLQLGKLKRSDDMEPIAITDFESNRSSHLSWGVHDREEWRALPSHRPPADVPQLNMSSLGRSGDDEQRAAIPSTKPQFPRTRHSSTVVSVPELAMSDRVRFNARVVTCNGRDVHRELCGFFFAQDNSLTLYEFRQLSSRSSALPLIQRNSYVHARGPRVGQPITLSDIDMGGSLTFDTCDQLSLPASMKCRQYVEFKVTDVDDLAKQRLLRYNRNKYGSPADNLRQSTEVENTLTTLMSSIRSQSRNQIKPRACHIWLTLIRRLSHLNRSEDGLVKLSEFLQTLNMYHIRINEEVVKRLCLLLYGDSTDLVDYNELLYCCLGKMNERRLQLVRKAFIKMDAHKSGFILLSEMKKFFNPRGHPDVFNGRRTEYDVIQELYSAVAGPKKKQEELSYAEFEAFYEGISMNIDDDDTFIDVMKRCWNV